MSALRLKILLAASTILGAGLWLARPADERSAVHVSVPSAATSAAPKTAPAQPSVAGSSHAASGVAPQASTRARLIDEFNAARNGRALVLDLWDRPAEGGRFYASALLDFCASIGSSTGLLRQAQPEIDHISSENHSKVIAAFDLIRARCAQFTDDELQRYSRSALLRRNEGGDPLVAAVTHLIKSANARSQAERALAVKELVLTGDPLVLDDVSTKLSLYSGSQGIYLYFDGNRYPINDDPPIAAAYYLLPCGAGLECGATDPGLAQLCILGNKCYADRFERVRKEMAGDDAAKYRAIVDMYGSMLSAVRSGHWSKFVPQ